MKGKRFIPFVFVSIAMFVLSAIANQVVPANAQATVAPTAPAAPPASKMRWDTLSVTVKDSKPFLAPGGIDSASANDGSYITIVGNGTFGPGTTDPVTGGGDWATFDANNVPTGKGKFTVTAFNGFDWAPGQLPPPSVLVDSIGNNADASSGVAGLRIAFTNADASAAGMGFLIISCHLPVGAPASIVEGLVVSKGMTLFYNPTHIVPGIDQGRTSFTVMH